MNQKIRDQFTRYEIARIIGARALQIAMDAPILVKFSEEELKEMSYDALRIAEAELDEDALPISIHRPSPRRGKDRLGMVKEDNVSDEELAEKEQEVEKEIAEDAEELGFVNPEEAEDSEDSSSDDQ